MKPQTTRLICQDCSGMGGHKEIVIDETGEGPWYDCGWCNGTGYVTLQVRAEWLNMRKNAELMDGTNP